MYHECEIRGAQEAVGDDRGRLPDLWGRDREGGPEDAGAGGGELARRGSHVREDAGGMLSGP